MKFYTEGYIGGIVSTAIETQLLFQPSPPFLFTESVIEGEAVKKYCLLKAKDEHKGFTPARLIKCENDFIKMAFLRLNVSDALSLKCGRQKILIEMDESDTNIVLVWKTI